MRPASVWAPKAGWIDFGRRADLAGVFAASIRDRAPRRPPIPAAPLSCHEPCNGRAMTQLRRQLGHMALKRRALSMIPVAAIALGFAIAVYVVLTMPM